MEEKDNKVPENSNESSEEVQEDVRQKAELTDTEEDKEEARAAVPEEPNEPDEEVEGDDEKVPEDKQVAVKEEAKAGTRSEAGEHAQEKDRGGEDGDEEDSEEDEEERLLSALHFDSPEKQELFQTLKKFSHVQSMRVLDKALKEIKPHYDKIYQREEAEALKTFKAEGNDEGDFAYKGDATDHEFFALYEVLREKKQKFFSQLEKSKEENLQRKNQLLEQLRELVDGEESTTSINALKNLQAEWRKVGHVPGQYAKSLWANYNALIDRFYDHRSIYFELKELDRKKNLEAKLELCERAEALDKLENIKDAIFQLNELHEEFKHIGPVPKEEQEPLWQRFKGASDKVYARRKEYYDHLKGELNENMNKKLALGDQARTFAEFESDRISEWNKKTREILELQKQWDAIGGLPRDKAKEVNKHFWGNFKKFFGRKNAFFKSLEGLREENLKKKQELLERARKLKDSEEWDKAAGELKRLQTQWKDIGPVPEKQRNEVYREFKSACDHFFERKRAQGSDQNKEFVENLKKKEQICSVLEAYLNSDTIDLEQVYDLLDQYASIGFVPRHAIKKIHDRYDRVTHELVSLEELSEQQRAELKMQVQVSKLKNSPHGNQKIHRKESAIKRKISAIESDISTWKTNIEFFADSKNAEQLRDDFHDKIENAEQELEELKKQLDVLNQV